jgi:hypothetical protein
MPKPRARLLTGETDEELAESFLNQMLQGGYAREV